MARRQRRDLSVFESSCHLPTCLSHTVEASHCPFNCWTSSREAVNTNFYSVWLDPTGNRTRVYRFSSRRSIHSTTDRLNLNFYAFMLIWVFMLWFSDIINCVIWLPKRSRIWKGCVIHSNFNSRLNQSAPKKWKNSINLDESDDLVSNVTQQHLSLFLLLFLINSHFGYLLRLQMIFSLNCCFSSSGFPMWLGKNSTPVRHDAAYKKTCITKVFVLF